MQHFASHGQGSQKDPEFKVTWDMLSCLRFLRNAAFNEFVKTNPNHDPDELLDIWARCTTLIHSVPLFKRN